MNNFVLSCENGYCRNANSRNLNNAKDEAKQLRNCIFQNVSLYQVLENGCHKLIEKYTPHNSYENE